MTASSELQRAAVVAEARTWLRTPYHPMGRVKGVGVDCAMLPAEVYAACGLIPPQDGELYPPDWHLHRSGERYLARVLAYARPTSTPRPGDLLLWRIGRCLAHGAIVTAYPAMIHAQTGLGVVEDSAEQAILQAIGHSGKPRERLAFTLWED